MSISTKPDLSKSYSASSLIETTAISSYTSSAKVITLIIGTNSTRYTVALHIFDQIKYIITMLRENQSHHNEKNKIYIVGTFPCDKTSSELLSYAALEVNINTYNKHLLNLGNIIILNFKIMNHHPSNKYKAQRN
ncbi:unnamed protein product [Rotaria socialis]|uniref:Uncharacterized protein n=1 Tax=Rotaria socialis TaxID=392032 RepID=A0A820SSK9_9BILA|nr:unnamed protein product [Rotaria socialis]CAF3428901.1 unnamed protein product [Rotaria socialis]CAF3480068.1 unnamed protein product [Rotaria socialis]CAF3671792.1 unnamed protein product [Rotaria socialis]CAF3810003.1 unnamed protein product [Rotaria socialis]